MSGKLGNSGQLARFRLKIENTLLSEMRTSMFPSREEGKGILLVRGSSTLKTMILPSCSSVY